MNCDMLLFFIFGAFANKLRHAKSPAERISTSNLQLVILSVFGDKAHFCKQNWCSKSSICADAFFLTELQRAQSSLFGDQAHYCIWPAAHEIVQFRGRSELLHVLNLLIIHCRGSSPFLRMNCDAHFRGHFLKVVLFRKPIAFPHLNCEFLHCPFSGTWRSCINELRRA